MVLFTNTDVSPDISNSYAITASLVSCVTLIVFVIPSPTNVTTPDLELSVLGFSVTDNVIFLLPLPDVEDTVNQL